MEAELAHHRQAKAAIKLQPPQHQQQIQPPQQIQCQVLKTVAVIKAEPVRHMQAKAAIKLRQHQHLLDKQLNRLHYLQYNPQLQVLYQVKLGKQVMVAHLNQGLILKLPGQTSLATEVKHIQEMLWRNNKFPQETLLAKRI